MSDGNHDWHMDNDGQDFICMKCGKVFHRTRDKVYPEDNDKCISSKRSHERLPARGGLPIFGLSRDFIRQ